MPPVHLRVLWRDTPRLAMHTVFSRKIRHDAFVVIAAAEARTSSLVPDRFIGAARPIVAGSVAPFDGGVRFTPWWYGNFPFLSIWTDITIFDPSDPSSTF